MSEIGLNIESPDLIYHCPMLRSDHPHRPCDKNLIRLAMLEERGLHQGLLHLCRECRGEKLVQKELPPDLPLAKGDGISPEAEKMEIALNNGVIESDGPFCPRHPEERQLVITKEGSRKGQVMGACALCMAERKSGRRKVEKPAPVAAAGSPAPLPPSPKERAEPAIQDFQGQIITPPAGFAPEIPVPDSMSLLQTLLVSLGYEHLWEPLVARAHKDYGTPELQVIYFIHKGLYL